MLRSDYPHGKIAFGPAGWSYPDWAGRVYGKGAGSGLELIASVFDLAEANTTWYRIPPPSLARGWLRKVEHNPGFGFAVKAWSGFTHERHWSGADVKAFLSAIEPLREADRLRAVLLQFPWSFRCGNESAAVLGKLLDGLAPAPLVVEFRHGSWDRPGVLRSLERRGVAFCNVDQPLFPGSLGATAHVTAPLAYVRLHGRNTTDWFREEAGRDQRYDYCYSIEELEPWAERIRELARHAREVIVVTNNHFRGQAVVNALELRFLVDAQEPRIPPAWLEAFPRLARSCRPRTAAQGDLFH